MKTQDGDLLLFLAKRLPRVFVLVLWAMSGGILPAQTGTAVPTLASYDLFVNQLMTKYKIPGASLALTQNGRLVHARGYGFADAQKTIAVQPDSLFRVASLSKAITAVAVMKLVEEGENKIHAPASPVLHQFQRAPRPGPGVGLTRITI